MSQAPPPPRPSSVRKRAAMLDAAGVLFLRDGFTAANMDELAERSGVAKQTIYAHFGSKESLFVAMVSRMNTSASERVRLDLADPADVVDIADDLEQWAAGLLDVVLEPDVVALRRLVIGVAERFPDLARAFWESGPASAMTVMAERFEQLADRGHLRIDDPQAAARSFNWLVTSHSLNAAMLLGTSGVPRRAERRRLATEAARVFLAAYAR